jgi:hypothetical protein
MWCATQVSVVTSDVADGAFDGNVYITLNGTEGSSEEVRAVQHKLWTHILRPVSRCKDASGCSLTQL